MQFEPAEVRKAQIQQETRRCIRLRGLHKSRRRGKRSHPPPLCGLPAPPELREKVFAELRGTVGCTHLSDALRALAEVPALAEHTRRSRTLCTRPRVM